MRLIWPLHIMLTCPCNVWPLTPHFYIVKMGLSRYTFFLFLLYNIVCVNSLEPPIEAVLACTHNLCFEQKRKNIYKQFSA